MNLANVMYAITMMKHPEFLTAKFQWSSSKPGMPSVRASFIRRANGQVACTLCVQNTLSVAGERRLKDAVAHLKLSGITPRVVRPSQRKRKKARGSGVSAKQQRALLRSLVGRRYE
jgi:hypothetical protein